MKPEAAIVQTDNIESLIRTIRGQKVILDADLARLCVVETRAFNRAVKRNADRFPPDFMFQLTRNEFDNLKYQFGTSSSGHGGRRKLPWAFTQNGAVMSANVLNSPQAVRMSVFVVRAFVKMREMLAGTRELAKQLKALEAKPTARLDVHESAIVEVLQRIMDILNPPPPPPEPPKRQIGFNGRPAEPGGKSAKDKAHSHHEIAPPRDYAPAVASGRSRPRR
jgi:hypothetical protein